ncbi:MAG: lytic murein transglycosylase B [Parashewanella sp.]
MSLVLFHQNVAAKNERADELKATFIQQQVDKGMSEQYITKLLGKAKYHQQIIDSISRPWEAKPWHQYYPIFLTEKRLQAGVKFWRQHKSTIEQAAEKFQVDPQTIVAIIGVETFYGAYLGKYPVLDSLYTLGFYYPPRAKFFRSELAQFIQLAKEEKLNINKVKGSYAGAMGYGQFISSSYRHYAVDFDQNGSRDLINSPADAIGSVANYLHKHGWKKGAPVALKLVSTTNKIERNKIWNKKKLKFKASDILTKDLHLAHNFDLDVAQPAMLVELQQPTAKEYWLGLKNFYVITRYNHSPLYAMAVYQFSEQLKQAYEK